MRAQPIVVAVVLAGVLASPAGAQPALPVFDQTRVYAAEAQFRQAVQPYQAAVTATPGNAEAHYWLGVAHLYAYRQSLLGLAPYAAGFLPQAITSLREALRLAPSHLGAALALHDALVLAGEREEAGALARAVLERSLPRLQLP